MNDTVPTELVITDVKKGTGPAITAGQTAVVHYTGWLYSPEAKDHKGKKFDSSKDRNDPFSFSVGGGEVIGGWDQGVVGMQVRRPPHAGDPALAGLRRPRRWRRDSRQRHAVV